MSAKRQESSVQNCTGSPKPRYGTLAHLHALFDAIEALGVPNDQIRTRDVDGTVMIIVEYVTCHGNVSASTGKIVSD